MLHWFVTAFFVVLSAEVAGDKLVYTTALLTRRYERFPLAVGLTAGFATKMALAVMFGRLLLSLPRPLLVASTILTLIAMVVRLCASESPQQPVARVRRSAEASAIAFASVVCGEWADPGQLAAVALVMQSGAPLIIWLAAVLAMMTKAFFALSIGAGLLRRLSERLPEPVVRYGSIAVLVCAGLVALAEMINT
jgi:putative Ca2+/H+ antiporter (TMEM165/GDT1 family)